MNISPLTLTSRWVIGSFLAISSIGWVQAQETPVKTLAKNDETSQKCQELTKNIDADLKAVVAAGCKPSDAQIAKMMDNPVGNLAMLVAQEDFTRIKGKDTDGYHNVSRTQIIPTFPVSLGSDWSLINRISISLNSYPVNKDAVSKNITKQAYADSNPFRPTGGLGDTVYVGLVAPTKIYKTESGASVVWGIGPTMSFPTASSPVLGSGKYSAGPTAVVAYLGKDWTLGLFPQHWWSFAGNKERSDVNLTNIQYFVYKNIDDKWRIGMSPNITIDWTAKGGNRVTVPVGLGVNYTTKIAGVPVRMGVEAQYSVIRPSQNPSSRWNFRFVIVPVIPTFML